MLNNIHPYLNEINQYVLDSIREERALRVLDNKVIGVDDIIILKSIRTRRSRAKDSKGKQMLEISFIRNGLNITNLLYNCNIVDMELKDGYILLLEEDYHNIIQEMLVNHLKEATQ